MSRVEGIGLIALGLIIAIASPFLTNVRLYLPLPRTRLGRRTALITEEAIACIVILYGIQGLFGATPLSDQLHEIQVILFIIGVMTFFASMFIDAIIFSEDEKKRQTDEI